MINTYYMSFYHYASFANEIAGSIALHPKLKSVYPHHPKSVVEKLTTASIDVVALTSISMLTVEAYEEGGRQKALAQAIGSLVCAFVVPNLILRDVVEWCCKKIKCSSIMRVLIGLLIVFCLFSAEPYVVALLEEIIDRIQNLL